MILLIAGNDEYRINARVEKIKTELGDLNNLKILKNGFDFAQIKTEVETMPFLSNNKVILLYNLFESKDKELLKNIENLLDNTPTEVDLVIVEQEMPKATTSLYKKIQKIGKIEVFSTLKDFEVAKWIEAKVKELNGNINREDANKLSIMIGNDLVRLENEIQKLLSYDKNITADSIEALVSPEFNESIFTLMDAISDKNTKKALVLLNKFTEQDEDPSYLLSMVARQIRNMLVIKDLSESGKKEIEIVKETGLHPFVVKKTLAQTKNFTMEKLLSLHSGLVAVNKELRSSNLDQKVILTRFFISFTN